MARGTSYGATGGTIYGSHTWSGGLTMAINIATDGPGDLFWEDHRRHDSSHIYLRVFGWLFSELTDHC